MLDLHEGILNEFAERARPQTERQFLRDGLRINRGRARWAADLRVELKRAALCMCGLPVKISTARQNAGQPATRCMGCARRAADSRKANYRLKKNRVA